MIIIWQVFVWNLETKKIENRWIVPLLNSKFNNEHAAIDCVQKMGYICPKHCELKAASLDFTSGVAKI